MATTRTSKSAGGRKARKSFSAASVREERDGADSSGVDILSRPKVSPVACGGRSIAAMLSTPTRLDTLLLDLRADEVQHALDARAGRGQGCDGDDRDQRDDQGVLDQRLTLLGPHLRQVEPHSERLKHVTLLSPLEGALSVVLLLFTRVRALPDTREWVVSPIP